MKGNRAREKALTGPEVKPSAGATTGVRNVRRRMRPEKLQWARRMRRNPPRAEALLWERLRSNRLGAKFRHQALILGYIADFWCPKARLVVELDGQSHTRPQQQAWDATRDAAMIARGITVLRIKNEEVFADLDAVASLVFQGVCAGLRTAEQRRTKAVGVSLSAGDRAGRRRAVGKAAKSRSPGASPGAESPFPFAAERPVAHRQTPRAHCKNGEGGTC